MIQEFEKKDFFDGEYIGNIWGWCIFLIGVVVIVLFFVFVVYWYYIFDVFFGLEVFDEIKEKFVVDSINFEKFG